MQFVWPAKNCAKWQITWNCNDAMSRNKFVPWSLQIEVGIANYDTIENERKWQMNSLRPWANFYDDWFLAWGLCNLLPAMRSAENFQIWKFFLPFIYFWAIRLRNTEVLGMS